MKHYHTRNHLNKGNKKTLNSIYLDHLVFGLYPVGYNSLHAKEESYNSNAGQARSAHIILSLTQEMLEIHRPTITIIKSTVFG